MVVSQAPCCVRIETDGRMIRLVRLNDTSRSGLIILLPPFPFNISTSDLYSFKRLGRSQLDVHPRKVVVDLTSLEDCVVPADLLLELGVDIGSVGGVELEEAGVCWLRRERGR